MRDIFSFFEKPRIRSLFQCDSHFTRVARKDSRVVAR